MLQAEKTEKTRNKILKVALKTFGEKGYDNTSIQEIADAAGYSVGSVYRQWKNKQQLFINAWNVYVSEYISEGIELMPESPTVDEMLDFLLERSEKFAADKYTYNLYPSSGMSPTIEDSAEMNRWAEEYQNMLYSFLKGVYPAAEERRLRTVAGVLHGVLNADAVNGSDLVVPHFYFDREAFRTCLLAIIRTCEMG